MVLRGIDSLWARVWHMPVLLGVVLLLVHCTPRGDNSGVSTPAAATVSPTLVAQALTSLLTLYQQGLVQHDIDRLQDLFQPTNTTSQAAQSQQTAASRQTDAGAFVAAAAFQETLSAALRGRMATALTILPATVQMTADHQQVTFLEVESAEEAATLTQWTRLWRTTWQLALVNTGGVVTLRIGAVRRQGPLVEVRLQGQVQAGALTRVEVLGTDEPFALAGIDVAVPETGTVQALVGPGPHFQGLVTPPLQPHPQPLRVHLRGRDGETFVVDHPYRLRAPGEGVVQRLDNTSGTRFFAVTVDPAGTVWAGGDQGGQLVQVTPGATRAAVLGSLVADATGRVEDIALDTLGRLHALVVAPLEAGDIVLDEGILCQTVNVYAPTYPLQVHDPQTGTLRPSPSTRVVASDAGAMWFAGSDGGVLRATDAFRHGQCPEAGVAVAYGPVFRRQPEGLPTNTVPAFVAGRDGTLWFGTALGLIRWQAGQFTPVPFAPDRALQGNPATLEALFQAVAAAIFAARPLTTVRLGEVSFLEAFGAPLVKEDLIFSAVEDAQGRLWVGTLGGGIRRLETTAGTPQQTLHLTRADGLGSNIISALAVGPDQTLWAATDAGVSRLHDVAGVVTITTFSAMDGLPTPVHDLVVDAAGMVWLATDGGLVRLLPQGALLRGRVQDAEAHPIAGADILIRGTPLRAVTDAVGQFVLTHLPPGTHVVQVESLLATGGPFTQALRTLSLGPGEEHLLEPVVLVPQAAAVPLSPAQEGQFPFPGAPEAALELAVGALRVSPGETPELRLTLLPLTALPLPLPPAFTAGAAADLQLRGAALTTPARVTLPNHGHLPAGQVVALLVLDATTLSYAQVGQGRVSDDGTLITTTSGGLTRLAPVVFASTPITTQSTLVAVTGDNQQGVVGDLLPTPLLVQVRDGTGQPIPGLSVLFTVTAGNGTLTPAAPQVTDAQGQVSVLFRMGTRAGVNQVTATVPGLLPLTLTAVGQADRTKTRLLRVAGNNQRGQPGEELPTPLVVRLEDQFQNPLVGERLTAELLRGVGTLRPATDPAAGSPQASTVTNAQGEAAFVLQVGETATAEDLVVQVAAPAPDLAAVRPVQFLAIVGTVDTPGRPRDIVVMRTTAYIADAGSLQIIDVTDPQHPQALPSMNLDGSEARLALDGARLYVATENPSRLHVLDITTPQTPVLLGTADLIAPGGVQRITGLVVQGALAYVSTEVGTSLSGTLQVVEIHDPLRPQVVGSMVLPAFLVGIAVSGSFAYVPADEAGLLVFDVHDPTAPALHAQLEGVFNTNVTIAGDFAYLIERRANVNYATVLDLQTPGAPQRRGAVAIQDIRSFDTRLSFAIAGQFAYLVEFAFGIQTIDIRDPDAPRLLDRLDTPSEALNITAQGAFLYVTDRLFGLQVIRGPATPEDFADPDHDSVITFFDAFPTNPAEAHDRDRDGLGENADPDDDNDGFPDVVDLDPLEPRIFPVRLPPAGTTTLVVDAASSLPAPARNGTPEAPYRAITEAIRAIRAIRADDTHQAVPVTLDVHAGTYAPRTTGEIFPLDFFRLSDVRLRGAGRNTTVIDAEFTEDVISLNKTLRISIEGFTIRHGANGVFINESAELTLRQNRITEHADDGIQLGINSTGGNTITDNIIERNTNDGLGMFENSAAVITDNTLCDNGGIGISVTSNSIAEMHSNVVCRNGSIGILVAESSTAELTANTVHENGIIGIIVAADATATLTANMVSANALDGVQVSSNATAELTANTVHENGRVGILVTVNATAVLTANTVLSNASDGIQVFNNGIAHIRGGTSDDNGGHGINVTTAATAFIGIDGEVVTIARNGGAGIRVRATPPSVAQLNTARIVFDGNTAGDILGPFTDFPDADLDGLSDDEEAQLGTDPHHPDTDGDTFPDGVEIAAGTAPLSARSVPVQILYGAAHTGPQGLSTFYALDPLSGRAIRLGPIGFQRISGMAVAASGTVYATGVHPLTRQHVLLTIDPVTGAGTAIGPTGVEALGLHTVTDLTFRHADQVLYAYLATGDAVGTIDLATAQVTVLGATDVRPGNGLAFSPTDTLWHADHSALSMAEQVSGVVTLVVPLTFASPADNRPRINALDFHPDTGVLFASLADGSAQEGAENYLATIDTSTGVVTIIGPTVAGLDAIAWFPLP